MAVSKFSQIAASGSNLTASDFLMAVQGGTTDVLFTPAQVFGFVNLSYASDVLTMRRGSNPQSLRIANIDDGAGNYERGVFDWTTTANTLTIDVQALGTGTQRVISIKHLDSATGAGTATFAATNCPATTLTTPYTWIKVTSSDGSTVYMPAWK